MHICILGVVRVKYNNFVIQWNPCITASQGEMHFGRYIEVAFAEGFGLV